MDRRDFLKLTTSAAPGALVLSSASCAPVMGVGAGSPRPLQEADLGGYIAGLDRGLERLSSSRVLGPRAPSGDEALARASLRTLFAVGMLGDLPYENQVDSTVQERLWQLAPEIDATTDGMRNHLELRTSSQWADLQLKLRHRRNPAMEIAGLLDNPAADLGLSRRRRLQTRALITEASMRLRSQPPELVVREYLEQTRKLEASDAMDVIARRNLAAHLGEAAFWNEHAALQQTTPRGLRTMGWGLGVFLASAVIVAAGGFIAVFGMTAGAIMLLVGLVQLAIDGGS
jgi:hypothetical protein